MATIYCLSPIFDMVQKNKVNRLRKVPMKDLHFRVIIDIESCLIVMAPCGLVVKLKAHKSGFPDGKSE